jgi:hypothetical protein
MIDPLLFLRPEWYEGEVPVELLGAVSLSRQCQSFIAGR